MYNFRIIAFSFAFALVFNMATVAGSKVAVNIDLWPVGSFVAKTKSVTGHWKKTAKGYVAKNVEVKLNKLDSGIKLRDKHMKKRYLQTKKYPKAILKKAVAKNGSSKFRGVLIIRGKERKIKGSFKIKNNKVVAVFKTKLSDYKIKEASYKGVGVEDEIEIRTTLPVKSSSRNLASKR